MLAARVAQEVPPKERAMKFLGVREMRASHEVLQEALEREGEVILTRHGKPFARVLPYTEDVRKVPSLKTFRDKQKRQRIPTAVAIRQERDER
jgi:antitoxin (DNA-binding transcriptional repressor) of toxin-antitoxin stability system